VRVERVLIVRLHGSLVGSVGHPRNPRPPYPCKYLEALLLQEGRVGVRFVDGLVHPRAQAGLVARVRRDEPDVVVLQANTLDLDLLRGTTASLRALPKPPVTILVGQVLAAPDLVDLASLPGLDLAVPGEAEQRVLGILRALDAGRSVGSLRADLEGAPPAIVERPSSLPWLRFTRADLHDYRMHYPLRMARRARWGHLLTSRGCHGGCLFCSPVTRESYGSRLRLRDPGELLGEVRRLVGLGATVLSLDDDDFTASREHVLAFCDGLVGMGEPPRWICHARIDDLDAELIQRMAAAGCVLLRFGVEAASPAVLRTLRKTARADWAELAGEVFDRCHAAGMATTALVLLGNPDETLEQARASVELAHRLQPDMVQFHYFTPYPGSLAWERYGHRFPADAVGRLYHYAAPPVNLSAMGSGELEALYRQAYRGFLLRPGFLLQHARRYLRFYGHNPDILIDLLPHRS
jgi:anaerobic magnesium-protoporphyrin IX monomethyl ester cyclase